MENHSLLHRAEDEFGEIRLFDDGQYRVLSFADGDEQSRLKTKAPHLLQHEYTQAMLIPLLYSQPKRVAILGLGGGALIHALWHYIPKIHIDAVELRPIVLETAKDYFKLPMSKRVNYHQANAVQFIANPSIKKVDFLMVDIYDSIGMDENVLSEDFIHNCSQNLKQHGWLILNCWIDNKDNIQLHENLNRRFQNIFALDTGSGNWVIFASNMSIQETAKELKTRAQKLSNQYEFSFTKWLSRLQSIS
ncbi:spermidine synthase [Marinomonas epiphytica]